MTKNKPKDAQADNKPLLETIIHTVKARRQENVQHPPIGKLFQRKPFDLEEPHRRVLDSCDSEAWGAFWSRLKGLIGVSLDSTSLLKVSWRMQTEKRL